VPQRTAAADFVTTTLQQPTPQRSCRAQVKGKIGKKTRREKVAIPCGEKCAIQ